MKQKPVLGVESIDLFFEKEPAVWDAVSRYQIQKSVLIQRFFFRYFSQKPDIIITEELEYKISDAANSDELESLGEIRKIHVSTGAAAAVPINQHPDTLLAYCFWGQRQTNQHIQ